MSDNNYIHTPLSNSQFDVVTEAIKTLTEARPIINKSYVSELGSYSVLPFEKSQQVAIDSFTDVRFFRLERLVLENKQLMMERLTAAYTALGTAGYTIFLFLDSDGQKTDFYIGVKAQPKAFSGNQAGHLLKNVFQGHFSGSHLEMISANSNDHKITTQSLLNRILSWNQEQQQKTVTAVTGIPSLSNEKEENFIQGIEHFIDAAEGHVYQALILAEPVNMHQLDTMQVGYQEMFTQLNPLLKQSITVSRDESHSIAVTLSEGITSSLSHSLNLAETHGKNHSTSHTQTEGRNFSSTVTDSQGYNSSFSQGTSHSTSELSTASKVMAFVPSILGTATSIATANPVIGYFVGRAAQSVTEVFRATETNGTTETTSSGHNYSTSRGTTKGESSSSSDSITKGKSYNKTKGITDTQSEGFNQNISDARTEVQGKGKQLSIEQTDKSIDYLLKKIELGIERIDEAKRYGGWHSAAYFMGHNQSVSQSLASIFLGLMRGRHSNNEESALNSWDTKESKNILSWLRNLSHPHILPPSSQTLKFDFFTQATLISGKEMAIQLGLPQKSTSTVAVIETKPFGRNIKNINAHKANSIYEKLELGKLFHLWNEHPQTVSLGINELSGHTFITGSTGSGKSNTVYHILNQLSTRHQISFLVIDPAKGEYKHVFGHRQDVTVLGTNPSQAELLKINPFRFPTDGVHILEHIDRLVEIFNVCWPMYAAMPAILKEAILDAYAQCGWNLTTSTNSIDNQIFPTFRDLLDSLESVVEKSAFSQEVKGNYTGALITRVRSLTNGLNSLIFNSNETDNDLLFNSNVIVDLSRVGSQETKSLIMGILVMRLGEHRMSYSGMNEPLRHVTVLEEAHNILKRTSTEQSSEGANVAGKSVELLSNAIAEMRTYGEGFIIADQSPNAVDISAIRNTNTKIIMRLPDEEDRQLVGKAAGATEEQIPEIAKLPQGVAVVYQNGWLEPVLCKVNYFDTPINTYHYANDSDTQINPVSTQLFNANLIRFLCNHELAQLEKIDWNILTKYIKLADYPSSLKYKLLDFMQKERTLGIPYQVKIVEFPNIQKKVFSELLQQNHNHICSLTLHPSEKEKFIEDTFGKLSNALFSHLDKYLTEI